MFSLFRGVGDVVMVYVEHAGVSEGRGDGGTDEVVDSEGDGNKYENSRVGLGEDVGATNEDDGESGPDSDSEASSAANFEYFAERDALCDKLVDMDVNVFEDINEELSNDINENINEELSNDINENINEDSDGESLHSHNNSGDDEPIGKYPEFDKSRNMKHVELKLGMIFANAAKFKTTLREHSIQQGYQYKYKKNEGLRRRQLIMDEARNYEVAVSVDHIFEVTQLLTTCNIDFDARSCTCRLWELTGIPCVHAATCLVHNNLDPVMINPGGNERWRGAGRGKGIIGRGTRRGRGVGRGNSAGVDIDGGANGVGVDSGAVVDSGVGASGPSVDRGVGASDAIIDSGAKTSTGLGSTMSSLMAPSRSLITAQIMEGMNDINNTIGRSSSPSAREAIQAFQKTLQRVRETSVENIATSVVEE
ncbi:hypothetical protein RJ639_002119 [Escallonia herrerae]|uniref:SWIM-type domain-containing protein n=1 Tax=Escallonia herrerae TaxID=1293975 RepID=A0AA88XJE2_9ASTE|nr:hypothetical protein RJ639_002119 [Escallonia herrerae]